MMHKSALLAMMNRTEPSLEFEIIEDWLEREIQPKMIEAAKNDERHYEFTVDVSERNPSLIRLVLQERGYSSLWWPVAYQAGVVVSRMKIRVCW